jgi:ABC-2 type transport system ATP-binding protein
VSEVKQQFKENLYSIELEQIPASSSSQQFEVIGKKANSLIIKINNGFRPNDVLQYFIQQNASVVSFNEMLPSLSDIFIKLVEGTPLARQFQSVTA